MPAELVTAVKLEADILGRARSEFDEQDLAKAVELLASCSGPETARVQRCALHLSGGVLEKLEHFMQVVRLDYRDVIFFAEYDSDGRRVRNFSQGFDLSLTQEHSNEGNRRKR